MKRIVFALFVIMILMCVFIGCADDAGGISVIPSDSLLKNENTEITEVSETTEASVTTKAPETTETPEITSEPLQTETDKVKTT